MGFGWLFLGYFATTLLTFNPVGSLIRVIGYCIIIMSFFKLRKYQRAFDIPLAASFLSLAVATVFAVSEISKYLYDALIIDVSLTSEILLDILRYADPISTFIFITALLWSIRVIAKETAVDSIADNSVRNFIFLCVYYVFYIARFLPFGFINDLSQEIAVITWLLYFAWMVLNLILIGSCYAKICDENDVDMQVKPSRFAFVNRYREEVEKRQEKAREEAAAYRKGKNENRKNRR